MPRSRAFKKYPGRGYAKYYGDKYAPEGYTWVLGKLCKKSDLRVEESEPEGSIEPSNQAPAMKRKTLWFDLRTTGPDPKYHGVLQFAGLIEINGELVDQLTVMMQPHPGAVIDQETIAGHGIKPADIAGFMPSDEGYRKVRAFFDKHVEMYDPKDKMYPAGYNVRGGLEFLQAMFKRFDKYGIGVYFNWRGVDPLPLLYLMDFAGRLSLSDYRLPALCSQFGIKADGRQDGLVAVRAARDLTRKLMSSALVGRESGSAR